MNKILLVTLYGESNFGNRLQNYALQSMVEKFGYEVVNLIVKPIVVDSWKLKAKTFLKLVLSRIGCSSAQKKYTKALRNKSFLVFREKYIKNLKYIPLGSISKTDFSAYSYGITGSDQVWHNWGNIENELAYYYLEFIDPEKRVSYAPSFGFTEFPAEDIEDHRKGLMEMNALSCREQEGCNLIKDLIVRDAQKVLDPTLLLSREDWEKIEKRPDFSAPGDYLLMFFLGEITEDYHREIERIKTSNGLKVLNINDLNDPKHYAVSPDQFIWLIHNAKVICTDSFHASVFSIIFSRNLRVFERMGKYENMFGRLHDLLEPLGLMDVVFGHGDGTKLSTVLSKEAAEYLERERASSLEYLHNALNSSKKEEK